MNQKPTDLTFVIPNMKIWTNFGVRSIEYFFQFYDG